MQGNIFHHFCKILAIIASNNSLSYSLSCHSMSPITNNVIYLPISSLSIILPHNSWVFFHSSSLQLFFQFRYFSLKYLHAHWLFFWCCIQSAIKLIEWIIHFDIVFSCDIISICHFYSYLYFFWNPSFVHVCCPPFSLCT